MVNVDVEGLFLIDNKLRLMSSHWTCECLMINCGTDFKQVAKEHRLFVNAMQELRKVLDKVECAEKAQFADYQAKDDIEKMYDR